MGMNYGRALELMKRMRFEGYGTVEGEKNYRTKVEKDTEQAIFEYGDVFTTAEIADMFYSEGSGSRHYTIGPTADNIFSDFIAGTNSQISSYTGNSAVNRAQQQADTFYDFISENNTETLNSASFIEGSTFQISNPDVNFNKPDGTIDTGSYMKSLEPFIDKMIEAYESDGKAGVSYEEFLNTELQKAGFKDVDSYIQAQIEEYKNLGYPVSPQLEAVLKDTMQNTFKEMFDNWDLNGDGTIDQMEMMSTFGAIDAADGSVDGKIDRETYINSTTIAAESVKGYATQFNNMFEEKNAEMLQANDPNAILSTEEKNHQKETKRAQLRRAFRDAISNSAQSAQRTQEGEFKRLIAPIIKSSFRYF